MNQLTNHTKASKKKPKFSTRDLETLVPELIHNSQFGNKLLDVLVTHLLNELKTRHHTSDDKQDKPKTLTLHLPPLEIDPVYSDDLKKIIPILVANKQLGNKFIEFLKLHTVEQLANGDNYYEKLIFKVASNIVAQISNFQSGLKNEIVSELINNYDWIDHLQKSKVDVKK